MELTLMELAILKEVPYPNILENGPDCRSRSWVSSGVWKTLKDPQNSTHREYLAALDRLIYLTYIERDGGMVRRTFKGHKAFVSNLKQLQLITQQLSAY